MVEQGDNWRVTAKDSGEGLRLQFRNPDERKLLADLFQRALIEEVRRRKNLWNFNSLNIWYEPQPFQIEDDIQAFRRFEIAVIPIDSVGLGVSVDIGTAFFTGLTVADYFLNKDSRYNEERFNFLSRRQHEQKGTLLYEVDNRHFTCYFVKFLHDVTCNSTTTIRVQNRTYSSLLDYYKQNYPELSVDPDDPVARVSFKGLIGHQLVAANRLYLSVMNEGIPQPLKNVDKIPPADRRNLIESFWYEMGSYPFGQGKPPVEKKFWSPEGNKIQLVNPPILKFAEEQKLNPPVEKSTEAYKEYYQHRCRLLNKKGCFHVPPAVERLIYFAVPAKVSKEMSETLAGGITEKLATLTRKNISYEIESYSTLEDAFDRLRKKRASGMVVFVFDSEDSATYFEIAFNLNAWRIKRITYNELRKKYAKYTKATAQQQQDGRSSKELSQWNSFVEKNTLDILQQLTCIPWSIASKLSYEAQLIIDVGKDKRYFALSLLICRDQQSDSSFLIDTIVNHKANNKQETINPKILKEAIVALVKRAKRRRFSPLRSVLVLRDGRECKGEIDGIKSAKKELQRLSLLTADVKLDIVDFHKTSQKRIRLWQKNEHTTINVLEGTALFLNEKTVVLTNTGAATLTQGTAMPLMLIARSEEVNMSVVAKDVFAAAQLNWSSPKVAQRLPLPLKRTDDELKNRMAQEIKRVG
jgi:hypothetical protein